MLVLFQCSLKHDRNLNSPLKSQNVGCIFCCSFPLKGEAANWDLPPCLAKLCQLSGRAVVVVMKLLFLYFSLQLFLTWSLPVCTTTGFWRSHKGLYIVVKLIFLWENKVLATYSAILLMSLPFYILFASGKRSHFPFCFSSHGRQLGTELPSFPSFFCFL